MDLINKAFLKMDLFSKPIQLTINRKPSYKTVLGGIVSFAVIVSIICITGFYLKDVLSHSAPTFFFESPDKDEFPIFPLNNTNFIMGLRIEDDNNNILDSSYFDIVTSYSEYLYTYDNRTDVYKLLSLVELTQKCTTKDFFIESRNTDGEVTGYSEMTDKMYYDESLGTFMCANFDNRLVGGDWTSSTMRFFSFFVKKCDSETEALRGITCQNKQAYKDKKFFVGFKILSYKFKPSNFSEPVTPSFLYSYLSISDSFTKYMMVDLSKYSFFADNNLVLGKTYEKEVISLDKYFVDVRNIGSKEGISDKIYVEMPVYLRKNFYQYTRSYMKLQDVLGIVGGFLSMFVYFISLFYNFYLSITYKYYLFESILDFRVDEGKGDKSISTNTLMAEDFDAFSKSPNVKPSMQKLKESDEIEVISLYHPIKSNDEKIEESQRFAEQERENIENGLIVVSINNGEEENETPNKDKKTSNDPPEPRPKNLTKRCTFIEDANSFEDKINSKENSMSEENDHNNEINLVKRQTRLLQIVDKFKKKRDRLATLELNRVEYLCYKYMYCIKKKTDKLHVEKKQILKLSENELFRRMDLVNLMKHLDQISLLENSILNKHQKYMLENKSKQIVYNKYSDDEVEQGKKIEEEAKVIALVDYLKRKKEAKTLSKVDYCLLENMDGDKKNRILSEIGL